MKTLIFFILIALFSIKAQEPFPFEIGNQWEYFVEIYFGNQGVSGSYQKMEIIEKMRLTNGKEYYRFTPCFLFADFQIGKGLNDSLKIDCLRSDSGKVYYYSLKDSSEHLLFDSNIQYSKDSIYYFDQWSRIFYIPVNWGVCKTSVKFGVIEDYESTGMIVSYDSKLKGCIINGQKYGEITEVENSDNSKSFSLSQNYPNPFNPLTEIRYSIPQRNFVLLKVYDLLGCEVKTLIEKDQNAGEYRVQFDGSSLPSGIYIYTLQAGNFRESKKLLLLK